MYCSRTRSVEWSHMWEAGVGVDHQHKRRRERGSLRSAEQSSAPQQAECARRTSSSPSGRCGRGRCARAPRVRPTGCLRRHTFPGRAQRPAGSVQQRTISTVLTYDHQQYFSFGSIAKYYSTECCTASNQNRNRKRTLLIGGNLVASCESCPRFECTRLTRSSAIQSIYSYEPGPRRCSCAKHTVHVETRTALPIRLLHSHIVM